jgi:hypothetical protein
VRSRHEGDWVTVTISDTGCGIAPESLQRIFAPFFTTKPVGEAMLKIRPSKKTLDAGSNPGKSIELWGVVGAALQKWRDSCMIPVFILTKTPDEPA